jgi:hypothetical protein
LYGIKIHEKITEKSNGKNIPHRILDTVIVYDIRGGFCQKGNGCVGFIVGIIKDGCTGKKKNRQKWE